MTIGELINEDLEAIAKETNKLNMLLLGHTHSNLCDSSSCVL